MNFFFLSNQVLRHSIKIGEKKTRSNLGKKIEKSKLSDLNRKSKSNEDRIQNILMTNINEKLDENREKRF